MEAGKQRLIEFVVVRVGPMKTAVLNKIPVVEWVLGTARKMRADACEGRSDWNEFWVATYRELGGRARTTGNKPCPMAAAYGLWYLGFLSEGTRKRRTWTVQEVNQELGKNAAYAVIAAQLLEAGQSTELDSLWSKVRSRFGTATGEEAAEREQGEIKLVVGLFTNEQLRSERS
jgi:hypothetical protein